MSTPIIRIQTAYTDGERITTSLYVSDCANCGVIFGMPRDMERNRRADAGTFYCPNGHSLHFGKSDVDKEREARETAERNAKWWEQRADVYRAEAEQNANSLRTTKGHLTRLKKRAEAGVCIHCNRTFQNVQRHMQSKHGDS